MTTKTPVVYDRIYLKTKPGDSRNMVIEYTDGYLGKDQVDEWRLIDLNTGHVIAKDSSVHEVIHIAACELSPEEEKEYVREVKKRDYRAFKDIPLKDQLRHIESDARDLEHDMKLDTNDGMITNPVLEATKRLNERYDYPCFCQEEYEEMGKVVILWEFDMHIVQG